MIPCRACKFMHPPTQQCSVAARLRVAAGIINGPNRNPVEPECNQSATITGVTCNHCATKDAEIARLRNQIESMTPKPPKRDRAEYYRSRRAAQKAKP